MNEEQIINELKARWVTKEELADMLELPATKDRERKARAYTEELTQRLASFNLCVLSTAAKKGYHIPNPSNEEDMDLANRAIEELKSKAISVFERRKPIENFVKNAMQFRDSKPVQLELF
jgi:hypothetical protein